MADSEDSAVPPASLVGDDSLYHECQEWHSAQPPYCEGFIYLRAAVSAWRSEAETIVALRQKHRAVFELRAVKRSFDATTMWRIRSQHRIRLAIFRDPRWLRQHFYRRDLSTVLDHWRTNNDQDPIVRYTEWPDDLGFTRIIFIEAHAKVRGKKRESRKGNNLFHSKWL